MTPELKAKWLEALPKYKKGKDQLMCDGAYCCLGVLADITGNLKVVNGRDGKQRGYVGDHDCVLSDAVRIEVGLSDEQSAYLATINDTTETFGEVIEYIKANI